MKNNTSKKETAKAVKINMGAQFIKFAKLNDREYSLFLWRAVTHDSVRHDLKKLIKYADDLLLKNLNSGSYDEAKTVQTVSERIKNMFWMSEHIAKGYKFEGIC